MGPPYLFLGLLVVTSGSLGTTTSEKRLKIVQILIRHRVKDYKKWKPLFDEHASKRKASGTKFL